MHARDYVEFNKIIGQDLLMVEAHWCPFRRHDAVGNLVPAIDRGVKSRADWECIVLPGQADVDERIQYLREYRETVKGTHMGATIATGAFMQTLYEFTVGLIDFMIMCRQQRDLVEEMLDASADYYCRIVEASLEVGIEILLVGDDYAWKQGTFLRPALHKELWFPRFERIIAPARKLGIPIIFHSDGKIDATVDWLIDAGVEGITPMDPYSVDYRDYKKRYGSRLCLFGNVDIEFPLVHGTPEDVEKDVIAHADVLMPGGRWVAGSSHSTTNYIPHENFVAMINAFHRHCCY